MSKKSLSTDDKKEARQETLVKTDTPKSNPLSWLSLLISLLLAGTGYFFYTTINTKLSLLAELSEQSLHSNSQALSLQISTTSGLKNSLETFSVNQLTLKKTLSEKIDVLQNQVKKSKRQWLISEAEYLASIANNQLYLVNDVATAISALEAADQRLKDNADPVTFPIRKQMAVEIIRLKQLELPDIVGLSSQLLALESSLSTLHISDPYAGKNQPVSIGKDKSSALPESVQQTLDDAWANFSKLIVIRHNDKPMAALMTPEQVELIRKNLALKLESARLALIQKNTPLYTASLDISAQWLADYFDPNTPAVKAAIKQIKKLQNTAINISLPDISQSLAMLRKLPLTRLQQDSAKQVAAKLNQAPVLVSQPVATIATTASTQEPLQ